MPESETIQKLTPMLAQYLEIKKNYPDSVLFYRMGDFYEMFFEDAVRTAPILEVQLTSRDRSSENPIPMCGVPHHSVSQYIQKLVAAGLKVAICEQMENPAEAKGIVKRDVVRVITPSLVGDPDLVAEDQQNYLLSVFPNKKNELEVAILELLAGQVRAGIIKDPKKLTEIFMEFSPKEVLHPDSLTAYWTSDIKKFFPTTLFTLRENYFKEKDSVAVNALKKYLQETQKISDLSYFSDPKPLLGADVLQMDSITYQSLEILRGYSEQGPSLFKVMDKTFTPMGKRRLKEELLHPLLDLEKISSRLDSVEEFQSDFELSEVLRKGLSQIRDLERLASKVALGLAMPRDLVSIREIQKCIPALKASLKKTQAKHLKKISTDLQALAEMTEHLEEALQDIAPSVIRDGGIFKDDYHPEISNLRRLTHDAKSTILALEASEKEKTGISNLKIKYSRVFGYTIEVTNSHLSKVPKHYIRKQTIANGERYITEELKNFEGKVLTADQKLKTLEEALFLELRQEVASQCENLLNNSRVLGELDMLLSFATVAKSNHYVRPQIHSGFEMEIEEGRHPVVEAFLAKNEFVPNSVFFSEQDLRTHVITGPNMAGKSTIMRQVALITLMAHMGSFVPAKRALIPLTESIFTRIGSQDDLAHGRSTFMVEMSEVARILSQATPRSLILIDEIGRGTSTYDGLSLAWSLVEYLHNEVKAKTLFATHFHEITALENQLKGLANFNVLVDRNAEEIVFLHRLVKGGCNQSYGIEVAKLAGLPTQVLSRAKQILGVLESHTDKNSQKRNKALDIHHLQLGFFDGNTPPENRAQLDG